MKSLNTEVLIIGGGIVGTSAALVLAKAGRRVTLLERDLCGARSSGINYGGVRRQGRPEVQLPLSQRAHEIWGDLQSLIGTTGEYERSGHFKLARSEADMQSLIAYAELSRPMAWGSNSSAANACASNVPGWGRGGRRLAVSGRWPGQSAPGLAGLCARSRAAGATLIERCEVLQVGHDGRDFVAEARQGSDTLQVRAEVLINCAGAWANRVAQSFGETVPLTSGHPSMVVTEPIAHFLPWSLGVEGGSIYCRQVARGNVVLGGGRGYEQDELRARASHDSILGLLPQAAALLPALRHVHIIRSWSGVEGYLPDQHPVIGPSTTQMGLLHGFGFCGAGFQIGPAAGEALAELVLHGRSTIALDAFSIGRFLPPRSDAVDLLSSHPERKIS
jgi:sarcosine oxidase subunit beta